MNTEIVNIASELGKKKASNKIHKTIIGGILAGMFISFGAVFSINTVAGLSGTIPYGIIKLLSGIVFSLGLILVMVAGAELFTGNSLLGISLFNKRISFLQMIKNWGIIRISNFIGTIIVIILLSLGGRETFGTNLIGNTVLNTGLHKLEYGFLQAFALGILCNILVCLGVRLAWKGKTVTDKILGIIFPVTAFVAAGFEHSVANMFYLGYAYTLKILGFTGSSGLETLTIKNIFLGNFLPVTLGNIIGGFVFVGLLYWILENKS